MIQVLVRRGLNHTIDEIIIEGHAGYADPGEDLVCAAVSAITFGFANAIEQLLKVNTVEEVGESGFLHFKVPSIENQEVYEKVQLLLSSMLISLDTIVESYGKYIRIKEVG